MFIILSLDVLWLLYSEFAWLSILLEDSCIKKAVSRTNAANNCELACVNHAAAGQVSTNTLLLL